MNDQFTKPFTDLFKAAPTGQIPAQVQSFVQDGLAKTRDAALNSIAAIKTGADSLGKVNVLAPKEAGEITAKMFDNTVANTEAAFGAAQAMTQAKSPVEAMQLQAQFLQSQFAKAGEQTKELFELSTKAAQKSVEDLSSAAKKATTGRKA
jgi:hypothetical protein